MQTIEDTVTDPLPADPGAVEVHPLTVDIGAELRNVNLAVALESLSFYLSM